MAFPGGFPSYVDREDIEQECLIKIPDIIADYAGKSGAALDTFVRTAIRNDARDYLKRQHRANNHAEPVALPWEVAGVCDSDGRSIRGDAACVAFREKYADVAFRLFTAPDASISEDDLDAVKGVLTPDQYRVYVCRYLLGMTQQEAADYLRTSREAIASRQRKALANLRKAGLPVPNAVA